MPARRWRARSLRDILYGAVPWASCAARSSWGFGELAGGATIGIALFTRGGSGNGAGAAREVRGGGWRRAGDDGAVLVLRGGGTSSSGEQGTVLVMRGGGAKVHDEGGGNGTGGRSIEGTAAESAGEDSGGGKHEVRADPGGEMGVGGSTTTRAEGAGASENADAGNLAARAEEGGVPTIRETGGGVNVRMGRAMTAGSAKRTPCLPGGDLGGEPEAADVISVSEDESSG